MVFQKISQTTNTPTTKTRPWSTQRWLSLDHLSRIHKKNYSRATFDVWIRYGYNEALETKKSNWPTFLGEQGTNVNCMLLIVQLSLDFVSDNSLWQKKKFQYLKWCSLSKILTETKSWDNQTIRSWTLFVLKYTDFRCPVLLRKSVNLLFFCFPGLHYIHT